MGYVFTVAENVVS